MNKQDAIGAIYKAIDEINEQQDNDKLHMDKALDTVIFGLDGRLDSLGLVNFIVALQEIVLDEYGAEIMLADERTLCQENCPFRSVEALADYMVNLLEEGNDGN